jgi:ATP-dependent Clp protease, protease subunit
MSNRTLPALEAPEPSRAMQYDLSPGTLQRWDSGVRMAAQGDNIVSILGVIGEDFWSSAAVTPAFVQRRLAEIGQRDVVVQINSPGGDFFDGQAIYNLLRLHSGQVTVQILGIAASAASIIAMAGDRIEMSPASWMMIHNTWMIMAGDRHAFADAIALMEKFDAAAASLYAARSGAKVGDVSAMMDAETFLSGEEAIAKGFADAVMPDAKITTGGQDAQQSAVRRLEMVMQRAGLARGERRAMLKELFASKPGAAGEEGTPSAAGSAAEITAGLTRLADSVRELRGTMATLTP